MHQQASFPDVKAVKKEKPKTRRVIADCSEKLKPEFDSTERVATVFTGAFNLSTTSIHGTILTLPFVFATCGLATSVCIILLFAFSSSLTLDILCRSARKLSVDSLPGIVAELSGLKFQLIYNVFVFGVKFALIVGSFILMRQIGTEIFDYFGHHIRDFYVLLIGVALSFPLTLMKSMVDLRFACYVSFCSILLVLLNMVVVLSLGLLGNSSQSISVSRLQIWPNTVNEVLTCIPLIAVLYIPNFGIMDVFRELHAPTPQRTRKLIRLTIAMMTFIYLAIGTTGYLALVYLFDNVPEDNIIRAFPSRDSDMIAARFLMFLVIVCNIPVMVVPARSFLSSLGSIFVAAFRQSCGDCIDKREGAFGTNGEFGKRYGSTDEAGELKPLRADRVEQFYAQLEEGDKQGAFVAVEGEEGEEEGEEEEERSVFSDDFDTEGFADSVQGDALNGNEPTTSEQRFEGGSHFESSSLLSVCPAIGFWKDCPRIVLLNVVILTVTIVVANNVPDKVSLVWQVAGSLVVLPVTMTIPAAFYVLLGWKLHADNDSLTYIAYIMVLLSLPVIAICGYYNVAKLI